MSTLVLKSIARRLPAGQVKVRGLAVVIVTSLLATMTPNIALADKTDDIVNKGLSRAKSGAASQKRIDDIWDELGIMK